ncbi:MAG: hypothetical protein QF593_11095, partial [Nitrospinota bacterium]|nr:hypothetical protein [Nitrospinota bacterium]
APRKRGDRAQPVMEPGKACRTEGAKRNLLGGNATRIGRGPFAVSADISKPYRSTEDIVAAAASVALENARQYSTMVDAWSSFM